MTLLFLDVETLGLELHHDVWEIAWAKDSGKVESMQVDHSLVHADPAALEVNGYKERFSPFAVASEEEVQALPHLFEGCTLVGANPSFDSQRLMRRWGLKASEAPWHYRMLDVQAYAMPILGHERPQGLRTIYTELMEAYGWTITEPDHTAAGDVWCVRDCFYALQEIAEGMRSRMEK